VTAQTQVEARQSLAERYEVLIGVSQAISAFRDPKQLFRALAAELRRVVQFDGIGVVQYDASGNMVKWHLDERCPKCDEAPAPELAREETPTWWVYQNQQPFVVAAVDHETRFPRMMERLKGYGVQSACFLPLTTAHRRLGCLIIGSQHPAAYSREEVHFLSLVASQVSVAMDDALNFEASQRAQSDLQREKDRLKLLLELNNSVVSNLELRDLLRAVSPSVRRVMQCDGVAVDLLDPETNRLRIFALDFPEGKGFLQEEILLPVDGPAAKVLQTGQPLVMCPPTPERMNSEIYARVANEGIRSGCLVPLGNRNRTLGILALGRLEENPFTQDEVDFLVQVARQISLAIENALAYGEIRELRDQLAQEKLYLEDEIRSEIHFDEIVGKSEALRHVLQAVETVAATDSTVLILGETGTGKELIARAIHQRSPRQAHAFVKLNCAAIPTGLLESELFGHEKGAFTGAIAQRIGRFELAHRGTIFLDEIAEIPLELQPKLLRVLQEREFERLGSARTLRSDARLIAATNRDLPARVHEGQFRDDLFYRLNVFPIRVPPLRERPEDIPLLVRHFTEQFARRMNKTIESIPTRTMQALARYSWPGNVRELENVIERAVILSSGPVLQIPLADLKSRARPPAGAGNGTLQEAERKHILAVLNEANWVLSGPNGAAARLGMKRSTLQFRMRKLGIVRPQPAA
jgi:formate hydrogenlyase transcriptional activator